MEDDTCVHHPKYLSQVRAKSFQEGDEPYTTSTLIQEELEYASNYKAVLKKIPKKEVHPKTRPFELPFELCRLKQLQKRKKKRSGDPVEKPKQPTMLERSIMNQDEYMRWLAIPNIKYKATCPKSRKVKRCEMSPCPPRFVQLSAPLKRRVLSTWTEYQNKLPAEVLLRFQEMLHTDQNLKLRDADYYYKKIDARKRRLAKRKKRLNLKRKIKQARCRHLWIDENIFETTRAILEYLHQEPFYSLNYKQMLISDQILSILDEKNVLPKPSRTSKNTYQKSFIEISDKLAVWIDTLTKFVDVQAVESAEDIPPITISTLTVEEEGEEGFTTEEEEEEEEEGRIDIGEEGEEGEIGEEGKLGAEDEEWDDIEDIQGQFGDTKGLTDQEGEDGITYDKDEFGEGLAQVDKTDEMDRTEFVEDEEMGFLDAEKQVGEEQQGDKNIDLAELTGDDQFGEDDITKLGLGEEKDKFEGMDLDMLRGLIQIYEERSPLDYLKNQVGSYPQYTYEEILNKMKAITLEKEGPKKSKLEEALIQWLKDVAPDEVNERTLKAIHEYACALLDELRKQGYTEEDLDRLGTIIEGEDAGQEAIRQMEDIIRQEEAETGERIDLLYAGEDYTHLDMLGEDGQMEDDLLKSQAYGKDGVELDEHGRPIVKGPGETAEEEGDYIYGHKPPVVEEHTLDAICCLSLKIWAVWLLEVIHNAHTWTKWMHEIVGKVREYASIVRGDVKDADGKKKVLLKSEWEEFVKETEKKVIAWRQYSAHVNQLSDEIIENFRDKRVFCCPKCLQDHLIKNVVTAHNTFTALTEAMKCAQYWRRCLDGLVETTASIAIIEKQAGEGSSSTSSEVSSDADEIEELSIETSDSDEDDESIYEIEEIRP